MPYDQPILPNGKAILSAYNQRQLSIFKQNSSQTALSIYAPSRIPGVIAQTVPERYEKSTLYLREKGGYPIVDLISRNGTFHSFIWHTNAKHIREGVRYGIVKTQSLVGQVLGALGQYRILSLKRMREGYVSNRYNQKEALLTYYQDYIELFAPLESLVHCHPTQKQFTDTMTAYITKLEDLKKRAAQDSLQNRALSDAILNAQQYLQAHQASPPNDSTGPDSLFTFVKTEMIRILRQMQNENQNLTYDRKFRFAGTRGELNSYIEDAEKIIEDYRASPHDLIQDAHHGIYGVDDQKVIYDSSFHCKSDDAIENASLAITFIEGLNVCHFKDPKSPKLQCYHSTYDLSIVNGTAWYIGGGKGMIFKRIFSWLFNVSFKLLFGLIELPLTLLIEPLMFSYFAGFFNQVRRLATYEFHFKNHHAPILHGNDFLSQVKRRSTSLGLRVRHLLANVFKNTIQDIFYGIRDFYQTFSIHLFDDIKDDYHDGLPTIPLDTVIQEAESEMRIVSDHEATILRDKLRVINPPILPTTVTERFAVPSFAPGTGEYNDLLNRGAEGADAFVAWFTHHIHAKHPFAGLIFTLSYVASFLAVLAPQAVSFLGQWFITYSQQLGYSMANNPFSAAVGAGCTHAQFASAGFELLTNGQHCMLAHAANGIERDPFTISFYGGAALGLGYLLAYGLPIPGLSAVLRDDIGSFPPNALIFVGAKLGILVYELLKDNESDGTITSDTNFISQTTKNTPEKSFALLSFLFTYQTSLRYLSPKNKHRILNACYQYFSYEKANGFKEWLYPSPPVSIFRTTLMIIVCYPALLIRLLIAIGSSVIHRNSQPLKIASTAFGMTLLKDITRLGRAVTQLFKTGVGLIRRHLKTVGDVIFNTCFARTESLLFRSNRVATINYQVSAKLDTTYELLRQWFSQPLDQAIRRVTSAHPLSAGAYPSTDPPASCGEQSHCIPNQGLKPAV